MLPRHCTHLWGNCLGTRYGKFGQETCNEDFYKYMSTYTEQVDTTKIASLAYVQTGDETPAKPNDIPFIKVRTRGCDTSSFDRGSASCKCNTCARTISYRTG